MARNRNRSTLAELLAIRDRVHRASGARPMETVEELRAWLGEVGLAFVSGRGVLPSAAEAIAGAPIAGSWWADAQGRRIYRLLSELEEAPRGTLELALFEGKRTIVAPAQVAAVGALAADQARRDRVVAALPAVARRLFENLRAGDVPRSDDGRLDTPSWRRARGALEAGLLARSTSEHTPAGRHVAVLEVFHPAPSEVHDPLAAVVRAAIAAAVVAERSRILKGLRGVEPDGALREAAVAGAGARTVSGDGREWLTLIA